MLELTICNWKHKVDVGFAIQCGREKGEWQGNENIVFFKLSCDGEAANRGDENCQLQSTATYVV
jgi:hypothetical protein